MPDEICYCRGCGKTLKFIRTQKNALMPCDSWPVRYVPDEHGTLLYNEDGTTVWGRIVENNFVSAPMAWRPHWGTCLHPEKRKKKKKATGKAVKYSSVAEVMAAGEQMRRERLAKEEYDRRVAEERAAREREWAERQMSFFG